MANIMINENCNQRCPYCFASEFVNVQHNNISLENFRKAADFILSDKSNGRVGIIGGEPLLHPLFDTFVEDLLDREQVKRVAVFTNGVLIKKHLNVLLDKRVGILVNVNSINDVGEACFNQTQESLSLLIHNHKKESITIGLNIYDTIDYSFFIEMADRYNFSKVRLSVVVPAYGKEKKGISHFLALKNTVLQITKALLVRGIRFNFDCNLPVPCLWSKEELEDLKLMGLCTYEKELIPLEQSVCSPVIDILPDLTAIRCFGLSDVSKVSISDFDSIEALRDYFKSSIDAPLSQKPLYASCNNCELFPLRCYGGCLANRKNQTTT